MSNQYYDTLEIKNNPVYYNPNTNFLCTEADYKANLKSQMGSEDAPPTGLKEGCMKWYKYRDNNDGTVNMLLAHNTTAQISFPDTSIDNAQMIAEIKKQMNNDTSAWQVKARPISANEIAGITGNTSFKDTLHSFYLGTNKQDSPDSRIYNNKYSYLFDYTNNCIMYGCEYEDSSNAGYWTETPYTSGEWIRTWNINNFGSLANSNIGNTVYGLRPVVTILKSIVLD